MHQARLGDRVQVECLRVRKQDNGSAKPRTPKVMSFTVGSGDVMPGLSRGVVGMAPGEQKRFTLQPVDAFGPVRPALIKEIPRRLVPKSVELLVGKKLIVRSGATHRRRRVRIVQIKPSVVVVDGNHLLAGKVVELDVRMISVDSSDDNGRSKSRRGAG